MFCKMLALISLLVGSGSVTTAQGIAPPPAVESAIGQFQWQDILWRGGPPLHLTFTIESDNRDNKRPSPLGSRKIAGVATMRTVPELLDAVRAALPEATVFLDDHDRTVVHIVESSLYKDDNYIMNRKITLQFSGTESELIAKVAQQSAGAIRERGADVIGSMIMIPSHPDIPIKVDAAEYSYRSLVSIFGPKAEFGMILWQASEQIGASGKPQVSVEFNDKLIESPEVNIGLVQLLGQWGPTLSLHFTLERDLRPETGSDLIRLQFRQDRVKIKSADDLFAAILDRFPGTRMFPDSSNAAIIHIVESSLPVGQGVMDRQVSFRFSGTMASLLEQIHKETRGDLEADKDAATLPMMQLKMDIKGPKQQYRDVLCDFISLKDAPAILWTADCYHLDNRFVPGKKTQIVVGGMPPAPTTKPVN
jgi:hypothetical protein